MNAFLRGMVRAVAETFPLPEPILEIGSYQVAGQEGIADLRSLFPGCEYVGLDVRPGPGVDVIGDVEQLPLPDASVGSVLAICTFEHVQRFWKGFDEIYRVLRPGGAVLVACPFYFYIHQYPSDYWRFTPNSLEMLLEPYPSRIVGWHGPAKRPANVWSLAFREGRPPITPDEYARYRALMRRYAHQPVKWSRRIRYGLGKLLFGPRPFVPYLEVNRWDGRCVNRPVPASESAPRATPRATIGQRPEQRSGERTVHETSHVA
jgi:SAM-dependent methyltransferase